jgi:hypothetical protein
MAGAHGGGEEVDRTELIYEKVYALTVNLFSRNRLYGQLEVSLNLEAKTKESLTIKHLRPRLEDAYNRQLTRFGQTILDAKRPLDLHRLESVLQASTDDVLGRGKATVLLYSAIINQP